MPGIRLASAEARAGYAVLLVGLLAAIGAYAPALHAYFAQDDFALVALSRLLSAPWLVFVRDHFPASLYFRPLGVLVWWLTCAVAGAAAWPQYVVNLALHLGCALALSALLQRLRADAVGNALWTTLFALHPLATGTALWLADRFDLLTTLFALLALRAALGYVEAATPRRLVLTCLWLLLGLASKELGVVASAVVFTLVALAPRAQLAAAARWRALIAVAGVTLGWLAWRHAVLTPIPAANPFPLSAALLVDGCAHWLRAGLQFLARDPRAGLATSVALAIALALWLGAVVAGSRGARPRWRWHIAAALAVLVLLPAVVQAPVSARALGSIDAGTYWFNLIVSARFFHLALAGLVAAAMLATPVASISAWQHATRAALVLAAIAVAPVSWRTAHDYASHTREQHAPLQALEAALAEQALPASGCQIVLLGLGDVWSMPGYADAIAKALAPDPSRLAGCVISTERPPFAFFLRAGTLAIGDVSPYVPFEFAGQPLPWLALGNVQVAYLSMPADFVRRLPAQAIVLAWQDGRFVDVGEAVRSGTRAVAFATLPPR